MTGILLIITLLAALLHLVGGFIAFAWLLFLGQWWALGVGVATLLLARVIIPFTLVPGLWAFGSPAAILQRGPRPAWARPFYALLGANTVLVMGAWGLLFAWFFLSRAEPSTRIPLLLWSYTVALSPWIGLARKDFKKEEQQAKETGQQMSRLNAQAVTFLVQGAYICGGVAWLGGWTSFQMAALPLWTLSIVLMARLSIRQQEQKLYGRVAAIARPGAATIEGEGRAREPDPSDEDRSSG